MEPVPVVTGKDCVGLCDVAGDDHAAMEPVPVGTGKRSPCSGFLTSGFGGRCERWQRLSVKAATSSVVKDRTGPLTWERALIGVEPAIGALARRS